MQLLMQIQCNHSQKQTENELQGTNCKDKLTEQDKKTLLILKTKNKPLLFLVRVYWNLARPRGIEPRLPP